MGKQHDNQTDTIEEQMSDEASTEDIVEAAASDAVEDGKEEITSNVIKDNWEEKYKRALADYQNLEKRSLEQRREWIRSSNRELLLRILPVLDTLVLAKEHSDDQSLKVSVQQFLDILKAEGVTKIESVGKDFDPHLMEAVSTDEGEEGKVLKEMQAGYLLNDTLLRPAMVVVGKKAAS